MIFLAIDPFHYESVMLDDERISIDMEWKNMYDQMDQDNKEAIEEKTSNKSHWLLMWLYRSLQFSRNTVEMNINKEQI